MCVCGGSADSDSPKLRIYYEGMERFVAWDPTSTLGCSDGTKGLVSSSVLGVGPHPSWSSVWV